MSYADQMYDPDERWRKTLEERDAKIAQLTQERDHARREAQSLGVERNDALQEAERWKAMQKLTATNRELIQKERDALKEENYRLKDELNKPCKGCGS